MMHGVCKELIEEFFSWPNALEIAENSTQKIHRFAGYAHFSHRGCFVDLFELSKNCGIVMMCEIFAGRTMLEWLQDI